MYDATIVGISTKKKSLNLEINVPNVARELCVLMGLRVGLNEDP